MQGLAFCASRFALLQRQLDDNLDLQFLLDEPMQTSEAELRSSSCQSRFTSFCLGFAVQLHISLCHTKGLYLHQASNQTKAVVQFFHAVMERGTFVLLAL